ncbi:unnamed protein product, partial [Closterium sp. Naga37s-1]
MLSCVACLFSLDSSQAATDQNEVAALLQQKTEWGNPPQLRSWAVGGDPMLPAMGLEGSLLPDLGRLSFLTFLDLMNNNGIRGALPSALSSLSQLQVLSLRNCSLTGRIPAVYGALTALQVLLLDSNRLQGPLLGEESRGMLSLQHVDLSDNNLEGGVTFFPRLTSLKHL